MYKRYLTKRIALLMSLVLILTSAQTFTAFAENEEGATGSYSRGPEYVFSYDESAMSQLNDVFTTIDLQNATISDLQREMEAGNLTSEKLTGMYIDRIKAYDKSQNLNSIIWINEDALEDARRLDEERAAGQVRGKLHGIPIIVKDNYNVAGMPTSAGAVALADMVPNEDAGVVKKLRDAGAVIIAKANMSEFAWSADESHSTLGGDAHNAYDTGRSPAGSSGGSATAAASNFAPVALGTDTGGSIRNPSCMSDLFGIRPSKGLTSIAGVLPLVATRDTTGPMARHAEDMATVLEVMAGNDEKDDFTIEADADSLLGAGYTSEPLSSSLKGKRIGFLTSSFDFWSVSANYINQVFHEYYPEYPGNLVEQEDLPEDVMLSPELFELVRKTRADLRKAGAQFVDMSGADCLDEAFLAMVKNCSWNYPYNNETGKGSMEYDMNAFFDEYGKDIGIRSVKDLLSTGYDIGYMYNCLGDNFAGGPELADSFDRDDYASYGYELYGDNNYLRAKNWDRIKSVRDRISKAMEDNGVDAIMYLYTYAPAKIENTYDSYTNPSNYSRIFGPVLGLPDMNIPMGFISDGDDPNSEFPIGMYMVGRFGGEKELMEIAYAYEKQAAERINKAPYNTPALRDEELNSFLDALMEASCDLNPYEYGVTATSSAVKKLDDAYNKALDADYDDPYSVYDAAYELATAYDRIASKKNSTGYVLVKGQKIKNVSTLMFDKVEGINRYGSDNKKIATVSKKGVLKAKRPGTTVIRALDRKDKNNIITLSSCSITVVAKPKLKFPADLKLQEGGMTLNAYEAFVSDDVKLLVPDKWTSSKPSVAEIDEATGRITVKGQGRTKITAYFGNVKVKGTLTIK